MLKFGGRKELGPLMWVIGTKAAEIGFDFLIGSFGLSIGLRMVSGRKSNVIFEDPGKFFGERGSKLWSSVRDESLGTGSPDKGVVNRPSLQQKRKGRLVGIWMEQSVQS